MLNWLSTTTMGNHPYINVEVWDRGSSRNGTVITCNFSLCLKAIQGQSWWGYGVNVSWGWYDRWGTWIQGQDVYIRGNSETQWGDTWIERSFSVDVGSYDGGSINASYCVYPNSGAWGNNAPTQFWYAEGLTSPTVGSSAFRPSRVLGDWYQDMDISWYGYGDGAGNPIKNYTIFTREGDTANGPWSNQYGIVTLSASQRTYNTSWGTQGKWYQFFVSAIGTVENTYAAGPWSKSYHKNDRPGEPGAPTVSPSQINMTQPISLWWAACDDSRMRSSDAYEIEFERSRNGGNYVKVGRSVYSNTTTLTNYTGLNAYVQPGDLFRCRVRGFDYFDIASAWSYYSGFSARKSGVNYPVNGTWKGHQVYVVVNGRWTMCEVYTVKNNQWTQSIMI